MLKEYKLTISIRDNEVVDLKDEISRKMNEFKSFEKKYQIMIKDIEFLKK